MPSIEQLKRALDADPGDDFVLYALAMEYAKTGDHSTAIAYFDRAIGANPANAYHYFHKARSLEALDMPADAAATLREGLAVLPRHPDPKAAAELAGYLALLEG